MKPLLTALGLTGMLLMSPIQAEPEEGPGWCDDHPKMHDMKGRHEGGPMQHKMQRMIEELDLSEAQREQHKALHETLYPRVKANREALRQLKRELWQLDPDTESYGADVEKLAQRKGQLETEATLIRAEMRAGMHRILTPEQREQLKKKRDERREELREKMKQQRQ